MYFFDSTSRKKNFSAASSSAHTVPLRERRIPVTFRYPLEKSPSMLDHGYKVTSVITYSTSGKFPVICAW